MLKNLLVLIDTILDGYILDAEKPGETGEAKRNAVVAAVMVIIDAITAQYKVNGIITGVIRLVLPYLIDLAVNRLTAAGLINQHKTEAAG